MKEKESTFFYANTIPIWRKINEYPGNWNAAANFIRQLAYKENRRLDVWSGGFDVLKLGGEKIFLYGNKSHFDENRQIPVSKYLYKCVVDQKKREALCIIVINNPYLTLQKFKNPEHKYVICDIIDCSNDIFQSFSEFKYGYTYCCALDDFYYKNGERASLHDIAPFLNYKVLVL